MADQEEWRVRVKRFILLLLQGYKRFLSPFLPRACRFEPTCSVYMMQAIEIHGAFYGSWLGLRRLGRCQPFFEGGYDPVPGSIGRDSTGSSSNEVAEASHPSCCTQGSTITPLTSVSPAPTMAQSRSTPIPQ
jgi:hypothetical protein